MRVRKRTTAKSKPLEKPQPPQPPLPAPPVLAAATPRFGVPVTMGFVDTNDWLKRLDITATDQHWFVEVAIGVSDDAPEHTFSVTTDTRFHIYTYPQEWSFLFCHARQTSWIRIADRPYVHGRDDHGLVAFAPPLREISALMRELEHKHGITFRRDRSLVRTNLTSIESRVRDWVETL